MLGAKSECTIKLTVDTVVASLLLGREARVKDSEWLLLCLGVSR
ncbi:hypothetical protein ACJYIM_001194 [Vibrio parahaemolyticus]